MTQKATATTIDEIQTAVREARELAAFLAWTFASCDTEGATADVLQGAARVNEEIVRRLSKADGATDELAR